MFINALFPTVPKPRSAREWWRRRTGGRIWTESGGRAFGTRFTFTIPAVEEAGRAGTLPPRPDLRIRSQRAGADAGYAPIVTGDPEEVARIMEEQKPHLVLPDPMLPGADGIEPMKRILKITDVPVIFLSGYGGDQNIGRAFEWELPTTSSSPSRQPSRWRESRPSCAGRRRPTRPGRGNPTCWET